MFISATGLIAAWWAYKRRFIEFRDLRVWLACHELVARRCTLEKGRHPRFKPAELLPLVACKAEEHVRESLRRLIASGLMRWSERTIQFVQSTADITVGSSEELRQAVESVTNHRRKVPVPRRLLVWLACKKRPVLLATAIGHLLRCMYYRKGACRPDGRCKASWIAVTFGVDERNVKEARHELEAPCGDKPGILIREYASQRQLNCNGPAIRFNLEWEAPRCKIPPLRVQSTTKSPPPKRTGNSLSRDETQKPGSAGPNGVRKRTGQGRRHLVPEDLKSPARLLAWARKGLTPTRLLSECEELRVLAAAAHACRVASRNPCGLFVSTLRGDRGCVISLADEDAGRATLRGVLASRGNPQSKNRQLLELVTQTALARCMDTKARNVPRFAVTE